MARPAQFVKKLQRSFLTRFALTRCSNSKLFERPLVRVRMLFLTEKHENHRTGASPRLTASKRLAGFRFAVCRQRVTTTLCLSFITVEKWASRRFLLHPISLRHGSKKVAMPLFLNFQHRVLLSVQGAYQDPRYALRTASLCSRSEALPSMVILPVSST